MLKCTETTESKNPKVVRTKNGRIILLSKCVVVKEKLVSGLSSCLGINKYLNKIPLLGPFWF